MWRKLISNRYVARLGGAVGAGGTTYLLTGDRNAAILAAVQFIIYGTVHSAAQSTGNSGSNTSGV